MESIIVLRVGGGVLIVMFFPFLFFAMQSLYGDSYIAQSKFVSRARCIIAA
jgi:hypothetical protein